MKVATLAKLARGTVGEDELFELFASMGVDVKMKKMSIAERPGGCDNLKEWAIQDGASATALEATLKDGNKVFAILVIPA